MGVSSMKVYSVTELTAGDHVKWKRIPGYDHHAIVETVANGRVHVIEYSGNPIDKSNAQIKRTVVDDIKQMYKYIYDRCYDAVTVLRRARQRLGEKGYKVFTNNCEHFASWCKTGYKKCSQLSSFARRKCMYVAESAVAAVERGSAFAKVVARGGKAFVRSCAVQVQGVCRALFGVTCVVGEVALFAYNCIRAQDNYKSAVRRVGDNMKPRLKKQRNENIAEAGYEALGAVGGTVVGAAIGSFIPVVGTVIGGLFGGLGGRLLGKLFGRFMHRH